MNTLEQQVVALDQSLVELGFVRTQGLAVAAWEGQLDGRKCSVELVAYGQTRYHGEVRIRKRVAYRLRVVLETNVRTALFFVPEGIARNPLVRFIYRLRRQVVLDEATVPPGFSVVTRDAAWAASFLTQRTARTATAELLADKGTGEVVASIHFHPSASMGQLHYTSANLQQDKLEPEHVRWLFERLVTLANAAEYLLAPSVTVRVGAIGRWSEKHPALFGFTMFGGFVLLVGGAMYALLSLA